MNQRKQIVDMPSDSATPAVTVVENAQLVQSVNRENPVTMRIQDSQNLRRPALPRLDTPYEQLKLGERKSKKTVLDQNDPDYATQVDGVGPWEGELPDDSRLDPQLLREGDHRNVIDKYRYWTIEAIREDLAQSRSELQIAIENLEHDLNIGSIVRTGNAFNVGAVHIVGRHKWNRRGTVMTDRYMQVYSHPDPDDLAKWAAENDYVLVAVDNLPGSTQLEKTELPRRCLLVFGQESNGLTPHLLEKCEKAVYIPQFGSTRSMNVAAAAAIAMHWWIAQYRA